MTFFENFSEPDVARDMVGVRHRALARAESADKVQQANSPQLEGAFVWSDKVDRFIVLCLAEAGDTCQCDDPYQRQYNRSTNMYTQGRRC